MYKHRRLILGLIAGVMILALVVSLLASLIITARGASSADIRQQINSLQSQADAISAKKDELNTKISANKKETMSVVDQKLAVDQQIELTQEEIDNKTAQIQEYNRLISLKQSELDSALEQESDLYDQYRLRIRSMEEQGSVSYWAILFRSRSFADLLDNVNMISEIAVSDQLMLDKLEKIAGEISEARIELEGEKTSLVTAQKELEVTEQTLTDQRAKSDALIQELLADKAEMDESQAYYEQLEDDLVAEIAQREKEYDSALTSEQAAAAAAAQRPAASGGATGTVNSSGWCNPVGTTYVTSAYGYRYHPTQGNYSFHSGVDFGAGYGSPIFAARSGIVTTATYSDVYGYYVVINHGDGYSTLYGHMTNYCVSAGQSVSAGQTIGYVGSTGWSTGAHLHYTVYYNGSTVNPMSFIS